MIPGHEADLPLKFWVKYRISCINERRNGIQPVARRPCVRIPPPPPCADPGNHWHAKVHQMDPDKVRDSATKSGGEGGGEEESGGEKVVSSFG